MFTDGQIYGGAPALRNAGIVEVDAFVIQGAVGLKSLDVAAVPEPVSWALMIGGFGLAGGALRRRVRTTVAYT